MSESETYRFFQEELLFPSLCGESALPEAFRQAGATTVFVDDELDGDVYVAGLSLEKAEEIARRHGAYRLQ